MSAHVQFKDRHVVGPIDVEKKHRQTFLQNCQTEKAVLFYRHVNDTLKPHVLSCEEEEHYWLSENPHYYSFWSGV